MKNKILIVSLCASGFINILLVVFVSWHYGMGTFTETGHSTSATADAQLANPSPATPSTPAISTAPTTAHNDVDFQNDDTSIASQSTPKATNTQFAIPLISNDSQDSNEPSSTSDLDIASLQHDFRSVSWGDSMDAVTAAERQAGTPLLGNEASENILLYRVNLAGHDWILAYLFHNGSLARAKYILDEANVNKNKYLSTYNRIVELLRRKYGEQTETHNFWSDDLYRDTYSDYGIAISIGHYSVFDQWEDSNTAIISAISGENFKISVTIEYTGKEFQSALKEASESKSLEGL